MFGAVKAAGFGSVRIPCAWRSFADGEGNIGPARMARVKEVVDDALSCGLNIHTDGGWLEKNCTPRARAGMKVCDVPCVQAIRDAARDASLMLRGAGPPNEGKYRWH